MKSNVMPELSGVFVNIYGARRCVRRGREASLIMPFYSSASLLLLGATEHFSLSSLTFSLSHPLILSLLRVFYFPPCTISCLLPFFFLSLFPCLRFSHFSSLYYFSLSLVSASPLLTRRRSFLTLTPTNNILIIPFHLFDSCFSLAVMAARSCLLISLPTK